MPRLSAVFLAKGLKSVVTIVTVGFPNFSILDVSWIHHDVHDPQSPEAPMIKSEFCAMYFNPSIELPRAVLVSGFTSHILTIFKPSNRALSSSATSSKKRSALGLPFQKSPIVFPP